MSHKTVSIPCRSVVHNLPDGSKEILLYLNGRLAVTYVYDPKSDTLTETSGEEVETKAR